MQGREGIKKHETQGWGGECRENMSEAREKAEQDRSLAYQAQRQRHRLRSDFPMKDTCPDGKSVLPHGSVLLQSVAGEGATLE